MHLQANNPTDCTSILIALPGLPLSTYLFSYVGSTYYIIHYTNLSFILLQLLKHVK